MAGKTMIGGVAYDIKAGKTMIGGVAYDIKAGKTLVDGVAYGIKFGAEPFVIFQLGDIALQNGATFANKTNISITASRGIRLYPREEDTFAGFNILLDFTPYSTLHIGYKMASYPTVDNFVRRIGYCKNKYIRENTSDFNAYETIARGAEGEATFDISGVNEEKYIRAVSSDYVSTNNYITSIYLD